MSLLPLFTVGHSTHEAERFVRLLMSHSVTAVGDVRSYPFSRWAPQFNRENIVSTLKEVEIDYRYVGVELGGRSDDPSHYVNGKVDYRLVANSEKFKQGVARILRGLERYSIALLCAERDPLSCHRMILICRHLRELGLTIGHIHADGSLETQEAAEQRLLSIWKLDQPSMFRSAKDLLEQAYDLQESRIAYAGSSVGQVAE